MTRSNKLQYYTNKLFDLNWNKNNVLFLLIFSGALAVFLFGANIKAQWWVIDDHQIVYFLGNDRVLNANEIWGKLIQDTEVGHYLQLPRFRPVYYTMKLLECWAWGAKPSLWYGFRICVYAFFIGLFCYLLSRKVGCIVDGLLSLYAALQTYWVDIFSRLGPSECYAVLGLAVFGWGVYKVYNSQKVTRWWYILAGVVLCSGTKENFIFLILPLLYIVWSFYKQGKLNFVKAAISFGAFVWMMWIGLTIVISTLSYGGDVYKNSVGVRDKLLILVKSFERVDVLTLLFVCILLLFLVRLFVGKENVFVIEHYRMDVATATILSLVYISQIFIYNNEWPTGMRYDFPGVLVNPLMLVVLISFFGRMTMVGDYVRFRPGLILISIIVSFALAFSQTSNVRRISDFNNRNVERTVAFTEKIEKLTKLGVQNPDHVFIIQTDDPARDYEPVFSYFKFLRFYGAENQVSLLWAGQKPETYENALKIFLASNLRDLSYYGKLHPMVGGSDVDFIPFSEIDGSDTKCVMLLLSGEPQKNCQIIIMDNPR